MSHFLFLVYVMAVVLSCTSVEPSAQAASSSGLTQNGVVLLKSKLTPDEAVAAVRSKKANSGASFHVIRELDSNTATQEVAQHSLHEASSHHVSLYGDGIFLDLLNTGGFLILEVEATTGNATALHLVSSGTDGRAAIESHPIEGKVSASLAQELMKETADFVDILLTTQASGAGMLESRFDGGHFPEYDKSEDYSFFAVPRDMRKIPGDNSESGELAALFGGAQFWPIRYALSMPIYPADPNGALKSAWRKYEALFKEFAQRNNEKPDFGYDLQDLQSIRTSEQLRHRVAAFRDLDAFLEQKLRAQDGSTSVVNRSISSLAINLGSIESPEEHFYAVMTVPGIIVGWKLLDTGDLVVERVSLAGD